VSVISGGLSGLVCVRDDCGVTVADDHLARFGAVLDDLDREDAPWDVDQSVPDCAREALASFEALRPIIPIVLELGFAGAPGAEADADASWAARIALARRQALAVQAGGIDHGLALDNLRLLDRIETLIGVWPEDWGDVVRCRVQGLVDAAQRGAQRGTELRQSRQHPEVEDGPSVGWLLRHPTDHWLRAALPTVSDPVSRVLIEAQIATLAPSYQALCRLDLSGEEAEADTICEIQIVDASPGRWEEPASAVVIAAIKGDAPVGEHISVRLVEDPGGPFNGTLVSFLPDQRWRICARMLEDGSFLPLDGTRRLARPRG
jgi:hypothetical protein